MSSLHQAVLDLHPPEHPLLAVINRYRAIHTVMGIIGNTLFLTGSVLFLSGSRTTAIWLFIAGSTGMLIGSVGSAMVEYRDHRLSGGHQGRAG